MARLRFVPIDDGARDGACHLLRDSGGHQHSGRWDGQRWCYSSGEPIGRAIADYARHGE